VQSNFRKCLDKILVYEGGFVNDPHDPGGATNHGITIGTLKKIGIDVDGDGDSDIADLKALRPQDIEYVYKKFYWDPVQGDFLPKGVDLVAFDAAVNSGVARSGIWIQSTTKDVQDGSIGPITLGNILKMDPHVIIQRALDARLAFMHQAKNPKTGEMLWPRYKHSWQSRVDDVRASADKMVGA